LVSTDQMILLRVPAESRRSFAALQDDMASRDHRGERNGDSLINIEQFKFSLRIAISFPLHTTKPSCHPEASARDLQKLSVAVAYITAH